MSFEIVDSSPVAKDLAQNGRTSAGRDKYPFAALAVGKSFLVDYDAKKFTSLKANVARRNKSEDNTARFVVYHHADLNKIEVSRSA